MFDPHRTISPIERDPDRAIVELRHRLKRRRRIDTARRVAARSRPTLPETRRLDRALDDVMGDEAA